MITVKGTNLQHLLIHIISLLFNVILPESQFNIKNACTCTEGKSQLFQLQLIGHEFLQPLVTFFFVNINKKTTKMIYQNLEATICSDYRRLETILILNSILV